MNSRCLSLFLIASLMLPSCAPKAGLNVTVTRETEFTGRGNCAEPLLYLNLTPDPTCRVRSFDVELTGDSDDVSALCVMRHGEVLDRERVVPGKSRYHLHCGSRLFGNDTFSICADISMSSEEGDKVGAELVAVNVRGASIAPRKPAPGTREVLLCRKLVYKPGDMGSTHWRIPAIRQLSDGTLLIVNDQRNDSELDLPQRIDVVSRYSTDGGFTWSDPCYVARNEGCMFGYGVI